MTKANSQRINDASYRGLRNRRWFRKGMARRSFEVEPGITPKQASFLSALIRQVGTSGERQVRIAEVTKVDATRMINDLLRRREGPVVPLSAEQIAKRVAAITPVAPSPTDPRASAQTRLRPDEIAPASIDERGYLRFGDRRGI